MPEYIVHKAVNLDDVKVKLRKTMQYMADNYLAQPKRDGCCGVVHTSDALAYSRTGENCQALQPAGRYLQERLGPNLVILGEAWWPGKDQFSQINGTFRRHAESERLHFVIHDCLTAFEFLAGHSPEGYRTRMARLPATFDSPLYYRTPQYEPGNYGDPQALCNQLVAQGGHDGLILRDTSGTWTAGRGTTGEIVKIKQVLSFDLRVLERNTVTGEKTGRAVHKLIVDFRGKRLGVGSGVPHAIEDCPSVGDIVEIEAMDFSSEGLLREPRFKGIRFDKLEPDA